MEIILLFLLHVLVWFCFGALCALIGNRGAMQFRSAAALGVCSACAHLIARHLGYL